MRDDKQSRDSKFFEDSNYLNILCSFSDLEKEDITNLVKYQDYEKRKRLWAIFGKRRDNKDWICLQVGSSVDIVQELRSILRLMIARPEVKKISTQFQKDAYTFYLHKDKTSVKYRSVYRMCEEFDVYEIKVDSYIGNEDIGQYDKINYAEVKFAYEHKAWLWNPAPQTNGNKEQEILKLFLKEHKEGNNY